MAVVAGDFELMEDSEFRVPLTVAYRKSMAGFVPCTEILNYTKKGIEYYEELFGVQMPFGKYTQILVPEMYMGAMENAACVTINDNNLWKERPSKNEKHYFYNTILHELSHMWFGDLVTFTWWEDIWLNESFATYMSYQAQAEALQEDVWPSFFFYCARGYNLDIMSTTHPVHIEIKNTEEAQSSFDAITYSKGAALIKALIGVMGKTAFFRAMKDYFTQFRWKNVTMQDLFAVLQDYSDIDLSKWSEDWISTPGVNQLTQVFDPQLGLQLTQTAFPNRSQVLRSHAVTLTCYRDQRFSFNETRRELIPAKDSTVLPDYAKSAKFVFLNLDASCYVLTSYSLDQFSTLSSLSQCPLPDALGRSVLWTSLWYMVQTGNLSPVAYFRLAQVWIQSEVNEDVADSVISSVQKCVFQYIPTLEIERFATDFHGTLTDLLTTGPADLVPLYQKRILSFVYGLSAVLTMEDIMKRRSFSRTQKWHFLMIKSGFLSLLEVREMLEEELQYDGDTDMVRRFRYYCEASAYDNKPSTWDHILNDRSHYSLPELGYLMQGFNRQNQGEILTEFRPKMFSLLQTLIDREEREVLESYIEEMMPEYDPPREVIRSLSQITAGKTWVKQFIQKTIDHLEIRAKCQDRAIVSLVCHANR